MKLASLLTFLLVIVPKARSETPIVTGQIPPYTFEDDGRPAGVAIELVQAMAQRVGHSGKIRFVPWKRALAMAEKRSGEPTLIIPLNRSPEREGRFTWVTRLLKDETTLITRKSGKPKLDDPVKGLDYTVGVLLGSPLEAELRAKGFRKIDVGVDEETNARKLNAGRVDAWFVAAMVAPFVYRRLGLPSDELVYGATLRVNDLHLGASKNMPVAVVKAWRDAMDAVVASGEYAQILNKYRPAIVSSRIGPRVPALK